jgi:hypothetical protein
MKSGNLAAVCAIFCLSWPLMAVQPALAGGEDVHPPLGGECTTIRRNERPVGLSCRITGYLCASREQFPLGYDYWVVKRGVTSLQRISKVGHGNAVSIDHEYEECSGTDVTFNILQSGTYEFMVDFKGDNKPAFRESAEIRGDRFNRSFFLGKKLKVTINRRSVKFE